MSKRQKDTENLEAIAEKIHLYFSAKDTARENMLRLCRETIRYSANVIHAVHRREEAKAEQLLGSAHVSLQELTDSAFQKHNDLLYTGFVHDAQKEFAEASITLSIINAKSIPAPETLGVNYPA